MVVKGSLTPEDGKKRAILVLEDGTVVRGAGFGALKKVSGEVVFNTGMVGYPEAITDPSYKGQILMQTYPLIGNYGVSPASFESDGPKIEGYIVHELCREPSHWASELTLDEWLEKTGVPGIERVDTRMLTKRIRDKGTMLGILWTYEEGDEPDVEGLMEDVKTVSDPNERPLAYEVATNRVRRFDAGSELDVILIDCGVKSSIIKNIVERGFNVIQIPPKAPAEEIFGMEPVAVVLSNGPGDPKMYTEVIESTRRIIDKKIPVLGICLGSQIMTLSLGGDTHKLKFGHRGQNHPCIDLETGRCYITSQNHGFVTDARSIEKGELGVSLINANDKTVEGIRHRNRRVMGLQFHPEASPGLTDTDFLFDRFFKGLGNSPRGRRYAQV